MKSKRGCHDSQCQNCTVFEPTSTLMCNTSLTCQLLSPGRCFVCSGGLNLADLAVAGFVAWPGPPAPNPGFCQPCSYAPDNYLYSLSECRPGLGCGDCKPGMACGACGEKDSPLPACGDPRKGGAPYFWINAADKEGSGSRAAATPVAAEQAREHARARPPA
eukprot:CAMPEP_0181291280 /NCGR_PEP_ID=MMETSP1101-20121128/1881_1 /TAXON_ID=46948 /ORGANISM="Rhodomonas abbreviata, Strain Caron Lab Isolate" /LENGTH=161 /DNA_ID=CAMNT_0023395657 /DNA_START=1093 /DNA_END=1575 /DNA_ORIENTATION=-